MTKFNEFLYVLIIASFGLIVCWAVGICLMIMFLSSQITTDLIF